MSLMSLVLTGLLQILVAGSLSQAQALKQKPIASNAAETTSPSGLTLTLHTDSPKFVSGEMIILKATIKNVSSQTAYIPENGLTEDEFVLHVKDEQGVDVPRTLWGQAEHAVHVPRPHESNDFGIVASRVFAPGAEITFQFVLNREFDLSKSGFYYVTATRLHVPNLSWTQSCQLDSPTFKVQIVDPDFDITAPQDILHH